MNRQNTRTEKRRRSIDRKTVESQRYLCEIGQPFSSRVAAVVIPGRNFRGAL